MHTVRVNLGKRSYAITIGSGAMSKVGTLAKKLYLGTDAYIITNPYIKKRYGSRLGNALRKAGFGLEFAKVADTEKSKSVEAVVSTFTGIARFDKKKTIFIVAFGGGVIGDLAGFIAAIYKRGVPYLQIPTTLLAQIDSSIGGKTAVDLPHGKNLVGAFYQPRLVVSDTQLLASLPTRQIRSGLAEAIKYGIIRDPRLFAYIEREYRGILARRLRNLEFIVKRCSTIKAAIVRQDEREEKNIRTILNFGHTLGHAIEAAAGFTGYTHGEAVALGMLAASDISMRYGLIGKDVLRRIQNLIEAVGLPTRIEKVTRAGIIQAHYYDKKFIGVKNRFVLITGLGRTKIMEDIPLKLIGEVLKERM